jgi:hypothetical protein
MRDPKDIIINGKQLSDILESHKLWLSNQGGKNADLRNADLSSADLSNANLRNADLRNADLRNADLRNANLRSADLSNADLSYANLRSADLRNANLSYANLRNANLRNADLRNADLSYANLSNADLRNANLSNANLRNANLSNADLRNAKNIEMVNAITCITPEGDLIGWKKAVEGVIKLRIPTKARRSNATGRKCRAEYAVDIEHYLPNGKKTKNDFHSTFVKSFVYKIGVKIIPDKWDENRWEECSNGVHFFLTRWEAENYS